MGGIPPTPPHAVAEAKRMYEAGTFTVAQILKKTGMAKTILYRYAARDGWVKTAVEKSKPDTATPNWQPPKAVVREPLLGSKPVRFCEVPKGCCLFILGDMPGQMDQAPTCGRRGYPYCDEHADLVGGQPIEKKPGRAAAELTRSLRKYISP